ncbi:MAG: NAD+ synthase [Acidobacteriaceae bacterium]
MKLALAQINPTVGDFSGNTRKVIDFCRRADLLGARLVVFPELTVCGYPPADFLEKDSFIERAAAAIREIAEATRSMGVAVLCGTATRSDEPAGKRVRNTAVLLANGSIAFEQHKMLLPFYDVFDEQRYFQPASSQSLFELEGRKLAITICEDAWNDKGFWPRRAYDVDPVEELMAQFERTDAGARGDAADRPLILNISASPYWEGKRELRREMLAALAQRHGAAVVMVNQVGGNDSLVFDGTSLAVAADGQLLAQAASFVEDLVIVEVGGSHTSAPTSTSTHNATADAREICSTEAGSAAGDSFGEVAAVWSALVLGVRDYVAKCGFKKALVGLSGGIDSALVATIAVEALGKENVQGIGMPSQFSSRGSVDDSRLLAARLGIRYEVLPIGGVFEQYASVLQPLFAGTEFGLAEENLQSRIRGVLLMALSNKFNALVLTTGNKSEMSTGYCTLYGDMVGALAVIGDVWKTRVYKLARYVNRVGEVIPEATISKPPSAELRPDQKDTDSLPPYEVLDPILQAYVERYEPAEAIAASQHVDIELVRSVLRLVERSEYKRQQAALVLKVTQKSFGMGRRFPIAAKMQV